MTNGPPSSGQLVMIGSSVEADVVGHDVDDRTVAAGATSRRAQLAEQAARAPQLRRRRRQDCLGGVDEPFDQRVRPRPERQPGPPRGAEQVGDQREARP